MSVFTNATLMITGGTGSFGSTVLKHFLHLLRRGGELHPFTHQGALVVLAQVGDEGGDPFPKKRTQSRIKKPNKMQR